MANLAVQRIKDISTSRPPLFDEIDKKLEQVRQRAFEFFDKRGRQSGNELDDWIRAEHEVLGWPAAELEERDGEYKLEMTLPGYDANQVEVTATPTEIAVHAEIKPKRAEEAHIVWSEFGPNDVYRRFPLPKPIDVDRISASLDQGLLKIRAVKAS